ncbi:MAG: ribosome biogenesis GTP-binding protein YihA/YsxC [Burkholderiales bacterium]
MTHLIEHASFSLSADSPSGLPSDSVAEVAFAGRSNSGKSSALNAITGRRGLARVSKTPGRTRLINYFSLGGGRYLVDLPGYGYAAVPGEVKKHWADLLSLYLQTRDPLRGLVLLMDIRHPLTALDERMLDWFVPTGKPVHVLLTKSDKLSRSRATAQLSEVRSALSRRSAMCSVQLFSSSSKQGVEEARESIGGWFAPSGD